MTVELSSKSPAMHLKPTLKQKGGKDGVSDSDVATNKAESEGAASSRSVGFSLEARLKDEPWDIKSKKGKFEELETEEPDDEDDAGSGGESAAKAEEEALKKRRRMMVLKQQAAMKRKRSLVPKSRSLTSLYGAIPGGGDGDERKSSVLERLNARRAGALAKANAEAKQQAE
eukprot:CAMPEP_0167776668 /NCGR_PEP_ID=MMETSP0111_2-20121227/3255_1 /TAXON_ID=91324 /ORGANISM="Lotharella globosa, Strain CCCM811" /LENGTH=171 /DNA_ID=CAMNT_0007666745 /DNA_START=555 /DNA_END=1070 /DNA_ORIENTATION=-